LATACGNAFGLWWPGTRDHVGVFSFGVFFRQRNGICQSLLKDGPQSFPIFTTGITGRRIFLKKPFSLDHLSLVPVPYRQRGKKGPNGYNIYILGYYLARLSLMCSEVPWSMMVPSPLFPAPILRFQSYIHNKTFHS